MTTALDRRRSLTHAWFFAITASIGLLPGTCGLGMAALTGVLLPPVLWMWSIGLALLIGYWMVALGRDLPHGSGLLWAGSALYNGGLAAVWTIIGLDGLVRALERGAWDQAAAFLVGALWLLLLTGVSAHARSVEAAAADALALDGGTA